MINVGDILEHKDKSARLEVLRHEPDRYAEDRIWVRVHSVVPGGAYSFLEVGTEGYMDTTGNWLVVSKMTIPKVQQTLGIEGPSYNQRREEK